MKPHQWTYLRTGAMACFDAAGGETPCAGSGQDAEFRAGLPWPEPRFQLEGEGCALDLATGLIWTRSAGLAQFPQTWREALDFVSGMNARSDFGRTDWRLPNRRELSSLVDYAARRPALPSGHPFTQVSQAWYWTSTTSARAPGYAWHAHFEGGRMFYGKKDQYCLVWPVAGSSSVLPATGQFDCFDDAGDRIPCAGALAAGQDGAVRAGLSWPEPRFEAAPDGVRDRLTGLVWARRADASGITTWEQALAAAREAGEGFRLPTIRELESLVDASRNDPALPAEHPFVDTREAYWSSTTSGFEADWAFCLYLDKGAVGVGFKPGREFYVWLVKGPLAVVPRGA